jgi:hypothetical protein
MEYKLSEHDLKKIRNSDKTHYPVKIVKHHRELNVGLDDVLILLRFKQSDDAWVPENISSKIPIPKKYRVVHIDDNDVAWVKLIKVTGGLGKSLKCTLSIMLENERWEVDPKQLEAILLDKEYDPREQYRQYKAD